MIGTISTIMMLAAPILIIATGGMICERSGVTNVGLDGLMSIGACTAAIVHQLMEAAGVGRISLTVALLVAALVSMLISVLHAIASVDLKADQTISGTGINLLAAGITVFACQRIYGTDRSTEFKMGMVKDGLGFYPTLYIAIVVVVLAWFLLYKTPFGMHLRACGEHPAAADSVGINVRRIRYIGVLSSGFLGGLAGGCAVLTQTIQYTNTFVNGRGFIALAAVAFGRWTPLGVTGASLLFGTSLALSTISAMTPALKVIPTQVFNIIPYLVTLIALVIFSGRDYAPKAVGIPYEKGSS
ncbi:MAG: ABC transporter permease [Candidatus Ornithospirochaeta sp.]|nr:ABC transporter permease [Sphaerochaetaceae bacterium]MDY5524476.1 ABC transporter permease [Candidatus Ornithospirochaeta sp.]